MVNATTTITILAILMMMSRKIMTTVMKTKRMMCERGPITMLMAMMMLTMVMKMVRALQIVDPAILH